MVVRNHRVTRAKRQADYSTASVLCIPLTLCVAGVKMNVGLARDWMLSAQLLPRGVVVTRQPLELKSLVRIQAGQPQINNLSINLYHHLYFYSYIER